MIGAWRAFFVPITASLDLVARLKMLACSWKTGGAGMFLLAL
jgi:hypothetical protein